MGSVVDQEELIQKYLDEGNREAATRLLFELVTACAREKNFQAAEALRERIFEVDPFALTEIIRSGEIIEQEKNEAIDKTHRELWADLYDKLSAEEANAFYFGLKTQSYAPDQMIFTQGEHCPRLYFVNSGRLKIFYVKDGREMLLKAVGRSQIAGEDTFLCDTLCTTSMIALTRSEVSYLDARLLKQWKTEFPVLESKINDFVSRFQKIRDVILEQELDRRRMKRVHVYGRGEAYLVSSAGTPIGRPFKVDVSDISRGGIAFLVRITSRETARLLLGQRINIKYLHPLVNPSKTINRSGTIVAVRFHPFEDCSISMSFDDLLERRLLDEFERLSPQAIHFDYH